jgi:two-component system, chemotaxis family, response regulator Rcp1
VYRILLAEDNPGDVLLLREALVNSAITCDLIVADDGQKAMALLKTVAADTSRLPDLIILDVNLPKHNGGEVLANIRSDSAFAEVPVLMLTSSASPADQATASRLGANLYIQKPSDLDAFLGLGRVIASILTDRGGPAR